MNPRHSNASPHTRTSNAGLRAAVLTAFSTPRDTLAEELRRFSEKQWRANLKWLDTSGLALYLLDHLRREGLETLLPPAILARLQQNLADNTARNAALLEEAVDLCKEFEARGIVFAHTKGITLWPASFPDPALRCQLDLDFLLDAERAAEARILLEQRGYTLDFMVGKTWEFRAGVSAIAPLSDLYKAKPQRSIDLHLAPTNGLLERVESRLFAGVALPVLSPADQYIAQAKHLFKHLCCAFTRASWLLEYRRHMLARSTDTAFWDQLQQRLDEQPAAEIALAVVTLMVTEVFADPLPAMLAAIIARLATPAIRLWVRLYGRRALLVDFPGSKLHLLLQTVTSPQPPPLKTLLPLHLPPRITYGHAGESLLSRAKRYRAQLGFLLLRFRFHSVEGARYLVEAPRFRRLVTGLSR